MSQFNTQPVRRKSGELDVYTGLLLVATIVLAVGVAILFMTNSEHSGIDNKPGGPFEIVSP